MTLLAAAAILVGLYGLHRLAVWAEDRGYIYYLRRHGSSGSMSSAFLEVQAIIEPSVRHVVTEQRRERIEGEESGDPPPQEKLGRPRSALGAGRRVPPVAHRQHRQTSSRNRTVPSTAARL